MNSTPSRREPAPTAPEMPADAPTTLPHAPRYAQRPRTYFDLLLALYCVLLILSNIGATKGVAFGPILTDGGFFLFPLAYVLGDVVTEVYGFKAARRAIIASFVAGALASLSFWLTMILPAADFYENQSAFEAVLGPVPRIIGGSLLGFLVGQLFNAWVMALLKKWTGERYMWIRLIASTLVGEFFDTLIFCTIAAPILGIQEFGDFVNYLFVGYFYKCLIEVVLLPITYPVIGWFKRHEPTFPAGPVVPSHTAR
ncbi:queuosine precursor transporter [Leifsonia xyli]|uniref:queuosine precursor transporter n=1 Tax=Kocuria sp. HSID16901 TaxID=2419505 RepID=UPI0009E50477